MALKEIVPTGTVHFMTRSRERFELTQDRRLNSIATSGRMAVGDWIVFREYEEREYTGRWQAMLVVFDEGIGDSLRLCHYKPSSRPAFTMHPDYFGEGTVADIDAHVTRMARASRARNVVELMKKLEVTIDEVREQLDLTGGVR